MQIKSKWAPVLSARTALWLWLAGEITVLINLFDHWYWVVLGVMTIPLVAIGLLSILAGWVVNPIKLKFSDIIVLWLTEWLSFMVLFRGLQLLPKHCHVKCPVIRQRHVIFVHGFFCNAGMWAPLARKCEKLGFSTSFVELPSLVGSLDGFADCIQEEVDRIARARDNVRVSIVAFSMGGLAARACLARGSNSLFKLITVHSPHQGTYLAYFFAWIGVKSAMQMVPGSDWLTQLNRKESAQEYPFNVIWSQHDTIVMPAKLGKYGVSVDTEFGKGHLFAALDRHCHQLVIDTLMAGPTY